MCVCACVWPKGNYEIPRTSTQSAETTLTITTAMQRLHEVKMMALSTTRPIDCPQCFRYACCHTPRVATCVVCKMHAATFVNLCFEYVSIAAGPGGYTRKRITIDTQCIRLQLQYAWRPQRVHKSYIAVQQHIAHAKPFPPFYEILCLPFVRASLHNNVYICATYARKVFPANVTTRTNCKFLHNHIYRTQINIYNAGKSLLR